MRNGLGEDPISRSTLLKSNFCLNMVNPHIKQDNQSTLNLKKKANNNNIENLKKPNTKLMSLRHSYSKYVLRGLEDLVKREHVLSCSKFLSEAQWWTRERTDTIPVDATGKHKITVDERDGHAFQKH